jgi:hypothetical protein
MAMTVYSTAPNGPLHLAEDERVPVQGEGIGEQHREDAVEVE